MIDVYKRRSVAALAARRDHNIKILNGEFVFSSLLRKIVRYLCRISSLRFF